MFREMFQKIKKRDFSGNSGLAIKNSSYFFSSNFIGKIGSLIFTIIIARLLMPELFGLYSLTLATIILFATISELGTSKCIIKFVSNAITNKKRGKAKTYFLYFAKIKVFLLFLASFMLIVLAKYLATNYYNKPIYLALLAGSFYIIITGFIGLFETALQSINKFKPSLWKESIFQILRIILIPFLIIYVIKHNFSNEKILFSIITGLTMIYFFISIILFFIMKKEANFLKNKKVNLTKEEEKYSKRFFIFIMASILSGVFLGYIDIFMLGHFVEANFIGFYQAAFSIIGAIYPLIPFSFVLFPIFNKLKGKRLNEGFGKSLKIIMFFSFLFFIGVFIFAPLIIKIIFGNNYLSSIMILRILSCLIFITPITALYMDYFYVIGRPKLITILLITTTILDIFLNYFLITWLLNYSQIMAIIGAGIATILSKIILLICLILFKKKQMQLKGGKTK